VSELGAAAWRRGGEVAAAWRRRGEVAARVVSLITRDESKTQICQQTERQHTHAGGLGGIEEEG